MYEVLFFSIILLSKTNKDSYMSNMMNYTLKRIVKVSSGSG